MAVGLFAFGAAYVLMSDARIRRAMGALATLCAVVLTLACVWGLLRTDDIAPGATVATGLFVSALGGVLGIAAGFLVMRDTAEMEAAGGPDRASRPIRRRVTELPVAHPWFQAEDAGGGITRLFEPYVDAMLVSNVWHVPGRDADLLVDSANGIGPLEAARRRLHRTASR